MISSRLPRYRNLAAESSEAADNTETYGQTPASWSIVSRMSRFFRGVAALHPRQTFWKPNSGGKS